MTIIFNADTGISTPGLTNSGSETVSGTLQVGSITTNLYPLVSGTAVASTSGTSIDFTGIPAYAKRITVMLNGVSTSGASLVQIQIGSGSVTTSGYVWVGGYFYSGTGAASYTSGFNTDAASSGGATYVRYGNLVLNLITGNTWGASYVGSNTALNLVQAGSGSIALGGILDRVRITTVNGTDTFDAGSINVMWE
jgi:hypothetical protein